MGESAAQGTPDCAYSFGRILEAMLDHAHPGIHFQVITAAMLAINSPVVLEIGKDLAKYQPDLFVIYSGAQVLLCTLGCNLRDCPPFASMHRAGLGKDGLVEWTGLYEKGVQREGAARPPAATKNAC